MSRWYMTDEEKRGYDAYNQPGRDRYEGGYDYEKGWDQHAREERIAHEIREEDRLQREQAERDEERREYEQSQYEQAQAEAEYEQEQANQQQEGPDSSPSNHP